MFGPDAPATTALRNNLAVLYKYLGRFDDALRLYRRALEAALDFDTETVFFLTDGAPAGGKIVNPVEIVEVISRLNFTRRITINAIGIGVGGRDRGFKVNH